MVVFNCDSCGDVVKKPKIFNHMQSCAAWSFTCIDCSRTFDQQSVQGHTSCVTEHDKYAKGATKPGGFAANGFYNNGQPQQQQQQAPQQQQPDGLEFLSARPPWKCSVCNVSCTSKETLMGHASGVKHRRRAKAALAARAPAASGAPGTPAQPAGPATAATDAAPPAGSAKTAPADPTATMDGAAAVQSEPKKRQTAGAEAPEAPAKKKQKTGRKAAAAAGPESTVSETEEEDTRRKRQRLSEGGRSKATGTVSGSPELGEPASQPGQADADPAEAGQPPIGKQRNTKKVSRKADNLAAAEAAAKGGSKKHRRAGETDQQAEHPAKKSKRASSEVNGTAMEIDEPQPDCTHAAAANGESDKKFKWKQLAKEQLQASGGVMKLQKLQKRVRAAAGISKHAALMDQLTAEMLTKLQSSSQFEIRDDTVQLKQ